MPEAFSALKHGAYRQFATSLLLTSLGAQLLQTAVFWQVYDLTGDALLLGLTGLARAGPHILLSLVGGVAADRVHRVRLIQSGQLFNGMLVLVLAALTLAGTVEVWHLYAVTLLNSAFTALTQPARTAIIPWLVPRDRLTNAVGLNATIMQSALIVGPAFSGVVIGVMGIGTVYVVNGLFYVCAMLVIFGIRLPSMPASVDQNPWHSLTEGLAFVKSRPAITSLLALDLGQTVLGSYRALLPIVADDLGVGAGGYGMLSAAPGIGSVAGSAFMLSLGEMRYKGLYSIAGVLGYCGSLVVLAFSPFFVLSLVASGLLGVTNSVQMIPRNSAIIAMSPDRLRGRVDAFRSMLAGGGPPLGYSISGALASVLGTSLALFTGSVSCAVMVFLIAAWRRELRDPLLGAEDSEIDAGLDERDTQRTLAQR